MPKNTITLQSLYALVQAQGVALSAMRAGHDVQFRRIAEIQAQLDSAPEHGAVLRAALQSPRLSRPSPNGNGASGD